MKILVMPSSHHRKKHKHFHPTHHAAKPKSKGSAASVMAVAGGVLGLAIMYFASTGNIVLIIIGLVSGSLLGFLIGRSIDKSGENK